MCIPLVTTIVSDLEGNIEFAHMVLLDSVYPQSNAGRVQTGVFSLRKGNRFVAHRPPDKSACTGESLDHPKAGGLKIITLDHMLLGYNVARGSAGSSGSFPNQRSVLIKFFFLFFFWFAAHRRDRGLQDARHLVGKH